MWQDHQRWDTQQAIELAEGVEIRLRIAGPLMRMWACLLDGLFIGVGFTMIVLLAMLVGFAAGFNVATGVILLTMFFGFWIYSWVFEASRWGATPGKRICGLRVTQCSGAPITVGQAAVRSFIRFIDVMPAPFALIGLASCLASKRFQRLGDIAAGTLVVYDRTEVMPAGGVHVLGGSGPPPLQVHRPSVALRAEEARAIVSFRERSVFWSDARRIELANYLNEFTGSSGPDGVSKLLSMGHWLQENR